jgi:feruloyl esterase
MSGLPLGSEPYWSSWLALEDQQAWADDKKTIEDMLRHASFDEALPATFDVADFDFDHDPARIVAARADSDASSTDLSEFSGRGGKILIYHGLADVSPVGTSREWYDALVEEVGGAANAMEFARLFLVPGMDHCGFGSDPGVGHAGFDPLPALERWVEQGIPPESIVMTKTDSAGATEWTRPVCVFPNAAKYGGSGEITVAVNWNCGPAE